MFFGYLGYFPPVPGASMGEKDNEKLNRLVPEGLLSSARVIPLLFVSYFKMLLKISLISVIDNLES